MTSLSTRFLEQPRLMKPTFKRVYRPYGGGSSFRIASRSPRKLLPAARTRAFAMRYCLSFSIAGERVLLFRLPLSLVCRVGSRRFRLLDQLFGLFDLSAPHRHTG